MHITVWGINYAPELTGIAPCNKALCDHLREQGHSVRMVTSFAYYPSWKKSAADRGRLFRTDVVDEVPVHRCWHYVPERVSTLKRIVHEGTFVASSFLRLLTLPAPEAYVVVSPPLLLGAAAWLLGWLKRRPFVFHVQDLQPDAAAGLGMLKAGGLMQGLYRLESFAYAKAARISGIMPGMLAAFHAKGVPSHRTILFPNGIALPDLSTAPRRGTFRERHGWSPQDFVVLYSGNLGVKQGLDVLVEAARHVRDPRVRIVICGQGAQGPHLQQSITGLRLRNITMLPLQPEEQYREMLVDADVCVITQQRGAAGCFFPSKLLPTLAWAKPVLTVADRASELVHALETGGFGRNVEPGAPEKVAQMIDALCGDQAQLTEFAMNGRRYVERFELNAVLARFTAELERLVAETRSLETRAKIPAAGFPPP